MKHAPLLILLGLSLIGCSGSKSAQQTSEETPQIELSEADDFSEVGEAASTEKPAGDAVETPSEATADSSVGIDTTGMEEPTIDSAATTNSVTSAEPLVQESSLENASSGVTSISAGEPGALTQYTVQKNETLMMIAFKLYGDYGRWKELANLNSGVLGGGSNLRAGMVISYHAPAREFVWNPEGSPYLIRTGDTLGIISKQVYETTKKWKLLWENNRPLIKDPNKIYAGFTIYYKNGREVANEL